MRKGFLLLTSLLLTTGCFNCPRARVGWRFEVLRPPTLESESIVQSSGVNLGLLGQSSGGLRGDLAPPNAFAIAPPIPAPDVQLQERDEIFYALRMILQRLEALERSVGPTMPPAKSAPGGKSCQPQR